MLDVVVFLRTVVDKHYFGGLLCILGGLCYMVVDVLVFSCLIYRLCYELFPSQYAKYHHSTRKYHHSTAYRFTSVKFYIVNIVSFLLKLTLFVFIN